MILPIYQNFGIQPIYRNRSGNFHILKNKSINSKHIERIEARYCNMTPTWKNELGSSLVTRGLTSEVDFQISLPFRKQSLGS